MKTDLVSIVIPCYNQAHYLPDAIESALNQTYPNIEVIVVNDGSPDNTSEIVKKYLKVKLVEQKNKGLSGARNAGIKKAKGKYILPLDSDDKIHPEMVSTTINYMQDYDICSTGLKTFGDENRSWLSNVKEPKYRDFLQRNHINCCSLFKREVWERIKGYDEKMKLGFEDWDFWTRAAKENYKVRIIPDILFYYRKHGQTMFHDAIKRRDEIISYMRKKYNASGNMIDVVYVLGNQSIYNNNELRFSLRSLEKYCTGYNNIYIIGEKPYFLQNVIHYPYKDTTVKAISILNKIKYACTIPDISEKFLFINDDHFFCKPLDVTQMEYQYNNEERQKIIDTRPSGDDYRHLVLNTFKKFPDADYYDIHKPIIYEKSKFLSMCKNVKFENYSTGLLIKSTYCAVNGIKGIEAPDYILREKLDIEDINEYLKDADIFSIHDPAVNKDLINYFDTNYNHISQFEII